MADLIDLRDQCATIEAYATPNTPPHTKAHRLGKMLQSHIENFVKESEDDGQD